MNPPQVPAPAAPLVGNRRALVAVLMAVSLATLDSSITNTALPNIAAALQARPAASIWVVIAYQLAVVAALLPFAALADRLGARRVHLGGMAFFIAASLASALAWSLPALVAARALQGLGAAAMMSVNIALVRQIYPPQQLGRGVGLNALVVGVSFAVGPDAGVAAAGVAAVALAVCAEPAAGPAGLCGGLCVAAAHARRAASLSMRVAALLTALTFGAMLATPGHRGAARPGVGRAGAGAAGAGLRQAAAAPAGRAGGADAAGGPAAPAAVRAVGGHVDGLLRGAGPGLRVAALLHRKACCSASRCRPAS